MNEPHPLAAWIDGRMSQADFARQVGMSPGHLHTIMTGKRGVSLRQAIAIERATDRAVPAASLIRVKEAAE
jgi:DNA-binding transcriptional regulator YdaS (Cro superfamily)